VKPALLALADGTIFRARLRRDGRGGGRVVFNTSMTGYQEILTDPSYEGQLVAHDLPRDRERRREREDGRVAPPYCARLRVCASTARCVLVRAEESLGAYLARHGIPAIRGHRHACAGAPPARPRSQEAVLSSVDLNAERLVRRAKDSPGLSADLVAR